MRQDLELLRKILFAIEDQYQPGTDWMFGPNVEGYEMATVAEHCQLLHDKGYIRKYLPTRGDDQVISFRIGNLTADGYDYLELIRDDDFWEKIKAKAREQKVPSTLDSISKLAGVFWGNFFDQMKG
jgi:hypothetical protein